MSKHKKVFNKQKINNQEDSFEEKMKKRRKKRRRRLKLILSFSLIILFLGMLVMFARSSFFEIQTLEVSKTKHYKPEIILSKSAISKGNNAFEVLVQEFTSTKSLFSLRYGRTEKNIETQLAYIKDAKVNFVMPKTIRFNIVEREPYALLVEQNTSALIDNEGYVLEIVKNIDNIKLMHITGLKHTELKEGQAISSDMGENIRILNNIVSAISKIDENDSQKLKNFIKEIDIADAKNIKLQIDSRLNVNMGLLSDFSEVEYKLNYLKQIYTKHIGKNEKGTIDFTIGDKPRFIPDLKQ